MWGYGMAKEPTVKRQKLADFKPAEINPNAGNQNSVPMIVESIQTNGAGRPMLADKHGEMVGGSHSLQAFVDAGIDEAIVIEHDGTLPIIFKRTDLDIASPQGRSLQIGDNHINAQSYTPDVEITAQLLADLAETDSKLVSAAGFYAEDVQSILDGLDSSAGDVDGALTQYDVPDAIWPTNNEWGVPVLDLSMQADAVDLPVNTYGAVGRKSKMQGTYHFYTDDNRFEGLWNDPTPIINAGCVNAVEPNYSTNAQMPPALVLFHTYRKRWLARYWQSKGVRIFVDLDVNPMFDAINLYGVPTGWKSYACYMRKSDHEPDELLHFLDVAKERAGVDNILMLVIGGEKDVQKLCREHPQCVWAASFEQKFYRNYRQKNVTG